MYRARPDITDEMIKESHESGLSISDMVTKFSLSRNSIKVRLKKLGFDVPVRGSSLPPRFQPEDIQRYFDLGYGAQRTAKELGISESGLWHWISKYNLKSVHEYQAPSKDKYSCSLCDEQINRILYNERGTCRDCNHTMRRRYLKKRLIELKGGKCSQCGYNKCIGAMDFHHIKAKTDHFTKYLSTCLNVNPSESNIRLLFSELDKCVVLCSNCHREQHCEDYINGTWDSFYEDWFDIKYLEVWEKIITNLDSDIAQNSQSPFIQG